MVQRRFLVTTLSHRFGKKVRCEHMSEAYGEMYNWIERMKNRPNAIRIQLKTCCLYVRCQLQTVRDQCLSYTFGYFCKPYSQILDTVSLLLSVSFLSTTSLISRTYSKTFNCVFFSAICVRVCLYSFMFFVARKCGTSTSGDWNEVNNGFLIECNIRGLFRITNKHRTQCTPIANKMRN